MGTSWPHWSQRMASGLGRGRGIGHGVGSGVGGIRRRGTTCRRVVHGPSLRSWAHRRHGPEPASISRRSLSRAGSTVTHGPTCGSGRSRTQRVPSPGDAGPQTIAPTPSGKTPPRPPPSAGAGPATPGDSGRTVGWRWCASYVDLDGARVLDIGCGIGTYVRRFRQYTDDVYGIEVEAERVGRGEPGAAQHPAGLRRGAPVRGRASSTWCSPTRSSSTSMTTGRPSRRRCGSRSPAAPSSPSHPTGCTRSRPTVRISAGTIVFGNVPLVNWLPDPLRDRFVPHVRAYTPPRHPLAVPWPAGAPGPSRRHLSRL